MISEKMLLRLSRDNMWVPVSTNAIATLISNKLKNRADNMLHLSRN